MRHYPITILRGFIMATFEFQCWAVTPLCADGNEAVIGREPQIRRMKALLARPDDKGLVVASANMAAPVPLRRPGMAARWKGQHRLAKSG